MKRILLVRRAKSTSPDDIKKSYYKYFNQKELKMLSDKKTLIDVIMVDKVTQVEHEVKKMLDFLAPLKIKNTFMVVAVAQNYSELPEELKKDKMYIDTICRKKKRGLKKKKTQMYNFNLKWESGLVSGHVRARNPHAARILINGNLEDYIPGYKKIMQNLEISSMKYMKEKLNKDDIIFTYYHM